MSFAIGIAVLIGIYALGGVASAWLHHRLRIISIAHAAVCGSGAYAFAQAAVNGMPVWAAILLGSLVGMLAGMFVTALSSRLIGDDFPMVTFALQVIWVGIAANARDLTGGALGIGNIPNLPSADLLGTPLATLIWVSVILLISGLLLRRVGRSPFALGCAVVARSDELALTLGASPMIIRLQVGAVYGFILGIAGIVFASYLTFIDPTLFFVGTSVTILAIGFFTKTNEALGALSGSVVLIGVPELVRLLGVSPSRSGYLQLLMTGILVTIGAANYFRTSPQR